VRDQWTGGRVIPVLAGAIGTFPQFLNPDPPVLLQVPFRRALLHAIDRQALVDTLQAGISQVAHTHFQPNYPEYRDAQAQIVRYEFDARRAGQLIEGLGYTRGADGIFRDQTGERLLVELRSTPGREVNEKITLTVADFWQSAGVGVNTVIMPLQRNQDREYRQTRPAFEVVGMPGDVYRLHSREIPVPETRFVGDNRARYSNPELDALIDRYYVTIPQADRVGLFGQIMHLETDQVVQLPFLYEAGPLLVGNRIRNVTSVPVWNASMWEVSG
jgi:peptide/nickel transport system substrate-binding protein